MANIVIYTKSYCPYCHKVKALFDGKNIKYTEIDVENDDEKYQEMLEKDGGKTSVPQVFIDDKHIGGCDDTHAIDKRGELEKLLA